MSKGTEGGRNVSPGIGSEMNGIEKERRRKGGNCDGNDRSCIVMEWERSDKRWKSVGTKSKGSE